MVEQGYVAVNVPDGWRLKRDLSGNPIYRSPTPSDHYLNPIDGTPYKTTRPPDQDRFILEQVFAPAPEPKTRELEALVKIQIPAGYKLKTNSDGREEFRPPYPDEWYLDPESGRVKTSDSPPCLPRWILESEGHRDTVCPSCGRG